MVKNAKVQPSEKGGDSKVSIDLVRFLGEYFPAEEKDFRSLKELGVVTFRIRQATLDILTRTLLRGKKLIVHNWREVFPSIMEQFRASLPGSADISVDRNVVLVRYLVSDDDAFQRSAGIFSHYLGRYGVKTSIQSKERGDWYLTRIVCEPDPDLSPSGYFGSPDQMKSPMETILYMSSECRVRFSRMSWIDGSPVLELVFEDSHGGSFVPSFKRAFPIRLMGQQSAEEAAYFFAELAEFGRKFNSKELSSSRAKSEALNRLKEQQGTPDGRQK